MKGRTGVVAATLAALISAGCETEGKRTWPLLARELYVENTGAVALTGVVAIAPAATIQQTVTDRPKIADNG